VQNKLNNNFFFNRSKINNINVFICTQSIFVGIHHQLSCGIIYDKKNLYNIIKLKFNNNYQL